MPSAKRKRSAMDFLCGCFRTGGAMSPDQINIDHARGMSMSAPLGMVSISRFILSDCFKIFAIISNFSVFQNSKKLKGWQALTAPPNVQKLQMPAENEVNRRFMEVVQELELPVDKQVSLFALPLDKKWQLIVTKIAESEEKKGATDYPEYYIDNIKT